MDVVITAGGIPLPGDPLYEYTLGQPKALLDLHGKPMIQWVLDAFITSNSVENIIIVGLEDSSGLTCPKPLSLIPDQHGMLPNIRAGLAQSLELNPDARQVLMAASDIPAITPEIVDWVARTALEQDADLYYNVVRRETMEARFPGSQRTYLKLRDGAFCGGDFGAMRADLNFIDRPIWHTLINQRKNPLKQALTVGLDTLFGILTRTATLQQTASRGCERLHIHGAAIECPYAEIAMDVDKPHQLESLRTALAGS